MNCQICVIVTKPNWSSTVHKTFKGSVTLC